MTNFIFHMGLVINYCYEIACLLHDVWTKLATPYTHFSCLIGRLKIICWRQLEPSIYPRQKQDYPWNNY